MSTSTLRNSEFRFRPSTSNTSFREPKQERASLPGDERLGQFMNDLYQAISFEEEEEPNWELLSSLLHKNARFCRTTPEGLDMMSFEEFKAMARELIDVGVYTSFHEFEVQREVALFGKMAHILSAYETRICPGAQECLARGINSVQLLDIEGEWKMLSLFWDEGAAGPYERVETVFERGAL